MKKTYSVFSQCFIGGMLAAVLMGGCVLAAEAEKDEPVCCGIGALEIRTADYMNSDVNFRPSLPLQNRENRIAVRVRNRGGEALGQVRVTVRPKAGGAAIGEKILRIDGGASAEAEFAWTPAENGFTELAITAEYPAGRVEASVTAPNNFPTGATAACCPASGRESSGKRRPPPMPVI